jgi:hypothetical protein
LERRPRGRLFFCSERSLSFTLVRVAGMNGPLESSQNGVMME